MGKRKHLDKIEELLDKSPVVSFDAISRIAGPYSKQVINGLLKKKKVYRIAKGYYTTRNEASLLVHCFKPSYIGLQSALSYHNLWGQETIPVIVTSNKVRSGIRTIMGSNVLIRRCDKSHMFGYEYYDDSGFAIPYSDVEKTIIDFVVFRIKIPEESLARIRQRINPKKLRAYLKNYPEKIRKEVMNKIR